MSLKGHVALAYLGTQIQSKPMSSPTERPISQHLYFSPFIFTLGFLQSQSPTAQLPKQHGGCTNRSRSICFNGTLFPLGSDATSTKWK